ncbi:hypothetical protein MauCBS54593_005550 [Microsporum audouinii]
MSSHRENFSYPSPSTTVRGDPARNLNLELEEGALYIVIFGMAKAGTYHWALVVATSTRNGVLYHNTDRGGGFAVEIKLHSYVLNSRSFLAAIKVSDVTSYTRDFNVHFAKQIMQVPAAEHTCRTWLLSALYEIADQGLIDLQPNKAKIDLIENEVLFHAQDAVQKKKDKDEGIVVTSGQYDP